MLSVTFSEIETLAPHQTYAVILGADANFKGQAASLDDELKGGLRRVAKLSRQLKKKGDMVTIAAPSSSSSTGTAELERIILAVSDKSMKSLDWQNLGAQITAQALKEGAKTLVIRLDKEGDDADQVAIACQLAFGAQLEDYRFDKYFTTKKPEDMPSLKKLIIECEGGSAVANQSRKAFKPWKALAEAVHFTRDIVSEPANVIYPESLAKRCQDLTSLGLEIDVLDETKLKKLKMGALLGVGQGSARESRVVVLQWRGGASSQAPIALVGKGVTFDTGGISLKQPGGMEDMKWDMGGSAAVIGTLISAATRQIKQNVVGVVGLVENMPDGNAQRPGDVVTSMSGQTIEVINTDAEGRLVLADCLHFVQTEYKPHTIIDLATLTGAMVVALGHEYAGLFSNNDKLAKSLLKAGRESGEKLWQFPLDPAYDRQIKSQIADMKNVGDGRGAGSITAAQFLQRFIKDVAWAHLDIAGRAWGNQDVPTVPKGATGFGVRLLTHYLEHVK